MNFPNGVMRLSFCEESIGPSASAFSHMERNLMILKGLPK